MEDARDPALTGEQDGKKKSSLALKLVVGAVGCLVLLVVGIGLLATLVVPQVADALAASQISLVKADLLMFGAALDSYAIDHQGAYPRELRELWEGPDAYVDVGSRSIDPWGHAYVYVPPRDGRPFELRCLGADGVEGGEGPNADHDLEELRRGGF